MDYPRYRDSFTKPPANGWHIEFDGYDLRRNSREELITALEQYLTSIGVKSDAARMVEIYFCRENPSQCQWGPITRPA